MPRKLSSMLPSRSMAVAFAALLAATGGLAVAATSRSPIIRACANKRTGALRLAKRCHRNERGLTWNITGPIGAQGPRGFNGKQGVPGPAGATGATGTVNTSGFYTKGEADSRYVAQTLSRPYAWGQVRADASLRPVSPRVKTVTHPEKGLYCVLLTGSVESEPPEPAQSELEGTSVTLAGTTPQAVFPRVTNGQGADCSGEPAPVVAIRFYDAASTPQDARFSFIVP
jgi:hypothetical protein